MSRLLQILNGKKKIYIEFQLLQRETLQNDVKINQFSNLVEKLVSLFKNVQILEEFAETFAHRYIAVIMITNFFLQVSDSRLKPLSQWCLQVEFSKMTTLNVENDQQTLPTQAFKI